MKTTFLRTPYNYDMGAASDESGLKCEDKTLTKQSFRDECDINIIMERFGKTGELPENVRTPTYGDFTGLTDFRQAMNAVVAARESFDAMPAPVRARFHNDPAEFVDFCSDEGNRDEIRQMGLMTPEANAAWKLEGETAADLVKRNQEAADELKELKKVTTKGVT